MAIILGAVAVAVKDALKKPVIPFIEFHGFRVIFRVTTSAISSVIFSRILCQRAESRFSGSIRVSGNSAASPIACR